jgi:hypothetical protein
MGAYVWNTYVNCVGKIQSSSVQPGGMYSHHCAIKGIECLLQIIAYS